MVRFELCRRILSDIGFELPEGLEFAIRVTRDFYDNNKEFLHDMVRAWGRPAMVEMWNDRFFYFVMKYEWNFVDNQDKASALNTDQIDVENGKRYDITFTDEDGTKKNPLIMHMSPSGAIERVIFALLEKAHMDSMKGNKIMLPYWLSPTQVRLIPVSEGHLEYCEKILGELPGVRVDVDDTGRTVGKSIRFAEKEWIPFILVIGDKEQSSGELTVRIRRSKEQRTISLMDFKRLLLVEQGGMPYKPLPLPKYISKRVTFRG